MFLYKLHSPTKEFYSWNSFNNSSTGRMLVAHFSYIKFSFTFLDSNLYIIGNMKSDNHVAKITPIAWNTQYNQVLVFHLNKSIWNLCWFYFQIKGHVFFVNHTGIKVRFAFLIFHIAIESEPTDVVTAGSVFGGMWYTTTAYFSVKIHLQ